MSCFCRSLKENVDVFGDVYCESDLDFAIEKKQITQKIEENVMGTWSQMDNKRCEEVADDTRTELWMSVLSQKGMHSKAIIKYYTLLENEVPQTVIEAIERDIGRTFPDSELFTTGSGQQSMKNLLQAYAAYDPEVGYCQGMNFLAGLLLFFLPREDDAFGALVFLMQECGLRELYAPGMPLLEVWLAQLSELLPRFLLSHLESCGVLPVLFSWSWFLTCFAALFPMQVAGRVIDVILCQRYAGFMLKFAHTLLITHSKQIISLNDPEEIIHFLKFTIASKTVFELNDLLDEAWKCPWSKDQRCIVENYTFQESVHDSILRVEDALTYEERILDGEEYIIREKKQSFKRSVPKITRILSQIVVINMKHLQLLYKSSPLQHILKKL